MKTRLYIVEGLPCSGKSTTAKFVAQKTGGLFFDEGSGSHPADYEFQAYISDSELLNFSADEQDILKKSSLPHNGGLITQLSALSGELFEKALKYKIYDFLDWNTERQLMLDKWKSFADSADKDSVYVFNCVLLQNPMCETMMRFNFDPAVSFEHINSICDAIKPLSSTVIYLENNDIAQSVKSAVKERGDEWLNAVINYHCNGAYGKANGLSGFDGYIKALEERQVRELEILKKLPLNYTVIHDPQNNWEKAYSEIEKLL